MRNNGKQTIKAKKPSPNPADPAILPVEPDLPETDQDHGEGSYSGTRDYHHSLKAYLETANVEKDARDAAPDDAREARELEQAEQKGRRPGIKTQRSSKSK